MSEIFRDRLVPMDQHGWLSHKNGPMNLAGRTAGCKVGDRNGTSAIDLATSPPVSLL